MPAVEFSYPFTDDTCPPLESVVEFCENAKAWLDADLDNVVSLHCKGGKGRAGIMAACLMVRMGETAQAAVAKYDEVSALSLRTRLVRLTKPASNLSPSPSKRDVCTLVELKTVGALSWICTKAILNGSKNSEVRK